jgi:phosphatidylglycerophosphate synthase
VSTRTRRPSIAELRAVAQPPSIFARDSGEHWAGRLYIRRLSPHLTRALLRTPATPDAVTWLMILVGIAAAAVLALRGVLPAVGAVLLIQLQVLLDCSDGELARWLDRRSPAGVYLDRIGHWLTEAALPIALGIRADGGWGDLGTYTQLGLLAAVLSLLVRMESALVAVARFESGMERIPDTAALAAPRDGGLARVRRWAGAVPFFRAFIAVEATALALAAALVDAAVGGDAATRVLVIALVPIGAATAVGHLVAVLGSSRLR